MSAVLSLSSPSPANTHVLLSQMPHALWRGNQMAGQSAPGISTGHANLDRELPQGGWPCSSQIELLLPQAGIGELRLLRPALAARAPRRVALVQPPCIPQAAAWMEWGLSPERLLWVKAARSADALWSAEQILRNGSCSALLLWQQHVRPESLRRLHLAAQASDMLFWVLRPLAAAQDASPAPLRLGLRPASGGLLVEVLKRQGPRREQPIFLALDAPGGMPAPLSSTSQFSHHAIVDSRTSSASGARNPAPTLV
jgi:protein ImuA